jgi:bifunctional oligoribonuclease and PAP phosphatase NrnA
MEAGLLAVPPARRAALEQLCAPLASARTIALSTHINADGDGCGSEAALARMLAQRGTSVRIVNPTPWPGMFRFLLEGLDDRTADGAAALQGIDALVVVDISDVRRLGVLTDAVRRLKVPVFVIDHHEPGEEPNATLMAADTTACATGEMIYDLARVCDYELTPQTAAALYVAILTDTGGFRFSNTTPRCHAVAGELLAAGVDPEEMYRRIYASVPVGRLKLLRDALATLEVDPEYGISWVSVEAGAAEEHGLRSEDLDGIAEHPRSIAGTRLALFFRDLGHGKVKVSFRSAGEVDVNQFARRFGGGGHARASGALIAGSLEEVLHEVVGAARGYLGEFDAAERARSEAAAGAGSAGTQG